MVPDRDPRLSDLREPREMSERSWGERNREREREKERERERTRRRSLM